MKLQTRSRFPPVRHASPCTSLWIIVSFRDNPRSGWYYTSSYVSIWFVLSQEVRYALGYVKGILSLGGSPSNLRIGGAPSMNTGPIDPTTME